MSEYRIDVKVRNNLILDKIEQLGFKSVNDFCKINELDKQAIYNLINLKEKVFKYNGELTSIVIKLLDIFCCSLEDIFTENQLTCEIETNKRTYKVKEAELKFYLENSQETKFLEEIVDEDQQKKRIRELLNYLTPRTAEIIKMRIGLDENEKTLEEIGKIYGVNKERVRQIFEKGMRNLRHPSIRKKVGVLIEGEEGN